MKGRVILFQVLRDWLHPPEGDRGFEAARGDAERGGASARVQVGVPLHLRMGDQGPPRQGARLLPGDRAKCECTNASVPVSMGKRIHLHRL